MDINLELNTKSHERHKEKGSHQEKKPLVTGSNPFRPRQDSSSKKPHHKKSKKGRNIQIQNDRPHAALLNKHNKLVGSEKEGGLKKAYALIVVENTQLENASRGLRIGQAHQEASLERRENP
ncbi:hypothetical protein O181_006464 [Austropuccinia psidii MF-1]|uniref:Uncharacterized protein n=1 Tax=Austropuccinia psidii MF-1 TaxID=1389203 RepID=A0A9Q3GGX0_9BASI|nr:hypothetical protein [Austropuccinia psidii MF-1]